VPAGDAGSQDIEVLLVAAGVSVAGCPAVAAPVMNASATGPSAQNAFSAALQAFVLAEVLDHASVSRLTARCLTPTRSVGKMVSGPRLTCG